MATGTGSKGVEEYIDKRCVVTFRPIEGWNGEYGFDWFRNGDFEEFDGKKDKNGMEGKVKFNYEFDVNSINGNILGLGYRDKEGYPEREPYFDANSINAKNAADRYKYKYYKTIPIRSEMESDSKEKDYYVPYIFLPKNEKVDIELFFDVKNVTHIFFRGNKKKLEIDRPTELRHLPKAQNKEETMEVKATSVVGIKKMKIGITAKDIIDEECCIDVYAFNSHDKSDIGTLSGRLVVVPNQIYRVNYMGVNVLKNPTDSSNETSKVPPPNIHDYDNKVNKILSQIGVSIKGELNIQPLQMTNDDDYLVRNDREKDLANNFHNKLKNSHGEKIIIFFVPCEHPGIRLGVTIPIRHENLIEKLILIYKDNDSERLINTITHEMLHALGLKHSFQNVIDLDGTNAEDGYHPAFRFDRTNNIMDYGNYGKIMWHWQWDRVRDFAKKEEERYKSNVKKEGEKNKEYSRGIKEAYVNAFHRKN